MSPRLRLLGPLLLLALAGCGGGTTPQDDAELPAYCSTVEGSPDADFWRVVERSCRIATDGDVAQARALRGILRGLDEDEVADFHRAFVRLNRALYTEEFVAAADDACLPGIGLGTDLGTDFRSWVIAHGQRAYDGVRADAALLRDFPDLANGCGQGEAFGYAAFRVYAEKTGRRAAVRELPSLEPAGPPRP